MKDGGMFEFNLVTGQVTWANDFALEKIGYTISEIQTMTVFDIVPVVFHDNVRNNLADNLAGRPIKFFIWPTKSSNGQIVWWYVFRSETHHPLHWHKADFLQTTDPFGTAYAFMRTTMDTTNSYGQLHHQVSEIDRWIRQQVERLDESDADIRKSVTHIEEKMKHVLAAAQLAANSSQYNSRALDELKNVMTRNVDEIQGKFLEHTGEILRLIGSDSTQDKRLQAYESKLDTMTQFAVKAITAQADKASRGISRKVTIPVSGIVAMATLLNWIVQHWESISSHFTFLK